MKPLVTVVTITFNLIKAGREKTFRQSLESIHNQTYKNIEHIIIDGASQDGTIELLEEYAQKGWIKYYSESDTGIYNAFNKGIDRANGEYIVFVNSDDFYHSKFGIEKSVEALLESGATYSYADDYLLNEEKPSKSKIRKAKIHRIFHRMPFCHQTMFTKKSLFEEIGKFDETYRSAGDYEFIIRAFLRGHKGVKVNHNFCTFRMGGESNINEKISHQECIRIFQEKYAQFYPLTKHQAIKMFLTFCTPFKLLVKLIQFFDFKQLVCFSGFYARKAALSYRRELLQLRTSSKDTRLRILGKFFIEPKEIHSSFKDDGYID